MIKQRLITILVVLMALMPVTVAFAHYSELARQLSASQILLTAEMSDNGLSAPPDSDHCQTDKTHLASCSLHACVDCAITSSFGFFAILDTSRYGAGEILSSVSLLVPPDIKPPIIAC